MGHSGPGQSGKGGGEFKLRNRSTVGKKGEGKEKAQTRGSEAPYKGEHERKDDGPAGVLSREGREPGRGGLRASRRQVKRTWGANNGVVEFHMGQDRQARTKSKKSSKTQQKITDKPD